MVGFEIRMVVGRRRNSLCSALLAVLQTSHFFPETGRDFE